MLGAARAAYDGGIIAVVQPHRFTRLRDLFEELCSCFNDADVVIVADVYPAGEEAIEGIDASALVDGLRERGHRRVERLDRPENLAAMIAGVAKRGDVVICLGAGTSTNWANDLPAGLARALAARPAANGEAPA